MPTGDPRDDRYICAELLMQVGVDLVRAHQQIWRLAHRYRAGLNDKEYQYLLKQILAIKEAQENVRRVTDRCLHNPDL